MQQLSKKKPTKKEQDFVKLTECRKAIFRFMDQNYPQHLHTPISTDIDGKYHVERWLLHSKDENLEDATWLFRIHVHTETIMAFELKKIFDTSFQNLKL